MSTLDRLAAALSDRHTLDRELGADRYCLELAAESRGSADVTEVTVTTPRKVCRFSDEHTMSALDRLALALADPHLPQLLRLGSSSGPGDLPKTIQIF